MAKYKFEGGIHPDDQEIEVMRVLGRSDCALVTRAFIRASDILELHATGDNNSPVWTGIIDKTGKVRMNIYSLVRIKNRRDRLALLDTDAIFRPLGWVPVLKNPVGKYKNPEKEAAEKERQGMMVTATDVEIIEPETLNAEDVELTDLSEPVDDDIYLEGIL